MVSRKVTDLVMLYHDERKYRTELIEKERKTMQEILRRVQSSRVDDDDLAVEEEEDEEEEEQEIPVVKLETDHSELDSGDFACWLRSISQCLSNKISEDQMVNNTASLQQEFQADPRIAGSGVYSLTRNPKRQNFTRIKSFP